MHDVLASKDEMLLSEMPRSLDKLESYPLRLGGDQDTCSDQPWMDRHHTAKGRELDQSTLHTQTPETTKQKKVEKLQFKTHEYWIAQYDNMMHALSLGHA